MIITRLAPAQANPLFGEERTHQPARAVSKTIIGATTQAIRCVYVRCHAGNPSVTMRAICGYITICTTQINPTKNQV